MAVTFDVAYLTVTGSIGERSSETVKTKGVVPTFPSFFETSLILISHLSMFLPRPQRSFGVVVVVDVDLVVVVVGVVVVVVLLVVVDVEDDVVVVVLELVLDVEQYWYCPGVEQYWYPYE